MRLYVLITVVAMTINVTITSERVKHRHNQIEKPIMIRKNIGFSQKNVPFTESSVFFLHLLKCKPRYQKLDRIFPTSPSSVGDCICVPFYLCDRNRTIITDGTGIIDPRWVNYQSLIINIIYVVTPLRLILICYFVWTSNYNFILQFCYFNFI